MKRNQLLKKLQQLHQKDRKTIKQKNNDYADGEDPFQNFRMVEDAGLCSVEQGMLVRMSDKMQRAMNLLGDNERERSVKDERIEDTLSDLRNYTALLQVYLEQQQSDNNDTEFTEYFTDSENSWSEPVVMGTGIAFSGEEFDRIIQEVAEDINNKKQVENPEGLEEFVQEMQKVAEEKPLNIEQKEEEEGEERNCYEEATEIMAAAYGVTKKDLKKLCQESSEVFLDREMIAKGIAERDNL